MNTRKLFSTFSLLSGSIFTFLIFISYANVEETDSVDTDHSIVEENNLQQVIKSAYEDKTYYFAGEAMPNTFDCKERLDRELSVNAYWQSNTLLNLKKANRHFPIMERVLAEYGVPDDFKYLAVAESDLRNATSHANAKGFWQFRKLAAKDYGLEVNDEVDERYHVEKSTRAAAKYLKWLYKRYGSWANACAAYNMGPGNFSKVTKSQKEGSFYDLNVNIETGRYVFRLIAIKEIMSNPEGFGFYLDAHEKYPEIDTYQVEVKESVPSWSAFAKQNGISYRTLKVLNPWLIDSKLTVKKNTYYVKLPR